MRDTSACAAKSPRRFSSANIRVGSLRRRRRSATGSKLMRQPASTAPLVADGARGAAGAAGTAGAADMAGGAGGGGGRPPGRMVGSRVGGGEVPGVLGAPPVLRAPRIWLVPRARHAAARREYW